MELGAEIQRGFMNHSGIPGVVGAIECTHIPIQSPGGDMAELFRNRKGFFSINVQAINDDKCGCKMAGKYARQSDFRE